MGTFRCRQTKLEINILFAVCRVLSLFVFAETDWENNVPEPGTKILTE